MESSRGRVLEAACLSRPVLASINSHASSVTRSTADACPVRKSVPVQDFLLHHVRLYRTPDYYSLLVFLLLRPRSPALGRPGRHLHAVRP